jgi:hypothetical protein
MMIVQIAMIPLCGIPTAATVAGGGGGIID